MDRRTVVTNPPAANPAARPPTIAEIQEVMRNLTPQEWRAIRSGWPTIPRHLIPLTSLKSFHRRSRRQRYEALKRAMKRPLVSMMDAIVYQVLRDDFEPRRAEVSR